MALIVEDGTGKVDSEAYVSVADAKVYWTARQMSYASYSDDQIESAIRKAAQYIDGHYRFRDVKRTAAQAMSFPRAAGAVDYEGLEIAAVPKRLIHSNCELAFTALDGTDLLPATERGGLIKSETIGPISTTYMDGAPAGPAYLKIDAFLRPLLRLDQNPPVPHNMGPTDAPFAGVTLHDGVGGSIPGAEEQTDNVAE